MSSNSTRARCGERACSVQAQRPRVGTDEPHAGGLVREARSICRAHATAQLAIPSIDFEFPIRIAVSRRGSFVLGREVPQDALAGYPVQLLMEDSEYGSIAVQGRIEHGCLHDEQAIFAAVHGAEGAVARLEPQVVVWNRPPDDVYAFEPFEWELMDDWRAQDAEEIVRHLNDRHLDVLDVLVGEPVLEVISVDPDGLLIDCETRLAHVCFPVIARSAMQALDQIAGLIRSQPGARWGDTLDSP